MSKPKLLTEGELLAIVERVQKREQTQHDAESLIACHEALSDMLSDCWLALDEVARQKRPDTVSDFVESMIVQRHLARVLLTRQQAPGWKKEGVAT